MQTYTSKKTSINKNKLPASTKKIQWENFTGKKVLDIGGGKFDNLKDYLKENFNIELFIYDKYNRHWLENEKAIECNPDLIICNNVLNVIDSIDVIKSLVYFIEGYNKPFYISVYTGNGSNVGSVTGNDQYQRNEKVKEYLKYFNNSNVIIKNGMITNVK